jgi:hypothetical protein
MVIGFYINFNICLMHPNNLFAIQKSIFFTNSDSQKFNTIAQNLKEVQEF